MPVAAAALFAQFLAMPGIHQRLAAARARDADETPLAQSALAHVLLQLWAVGRLSAIYIQQISSAALADGCDHPELATLASYGGWGCSPQNCSRDLKQSMQRETKLHAELTIPTPCRNPKIGKTEEVAGSVLQPHKLFADFYEHYNGKFHEIFGTKYVDEFWNTINQNDVRVTHHAGLPTRAEDLQRCIPGWVHGDGVQYHERDSLMTWSWGSMLSMGFNSLISSFFFAAWPKLATAAGTWNTLLQVFVWSLLALASGCWPETQWDGTAWPPGSDDARRAQSPLAGGWRIVIMFLLGDHEHFSNEMGMPHWNCHEFCWMCDASRVGTIKKRWDYFAPDNQWLFKSIESEIASPTSTHPLFALGLTCFHIMVDILHAWDQGIWCHLAASFLKEIIYIHYSDHSPTDALVIVWQAIHWHYDMLGSNTRLTNLTLSMIVGSEKYPNKNVPVFKAKAAETRHLIPVLAMIAGELNDGSPHCLNRLATLQHAVQMQKAVDQQPMFMSAASQRFLVHHSKNFLVHYTVLRQWAKDTGFLGYHVVPKFHMGGVHLPLQCAFINPRFVWTYKAEDWVGRVSMIAHSASFGTGSHKLSYKLVEKYQFLLFLCFTRMFYED